ncbi:MAG: hypothetical protein HKN14_14735 [Marinicaulis sp.]|nr:alpha/beta hydrolase [Marinicaulis sp.]NNE42163.1 hypothetical protein [Marinicaulis sp.]
MNERIVQFGDDGRLSGVWNTQRKNSNRPTILLTNAGIIHRIGAHRLNVKLARRLADIGFDSLRFDLSGLGESAPAAGALGYERQSAQDISAAADFLEENGRSDSVIGIGMCSGADNFQRAALADHRLSGLVLLDPHAFPALGAAIENMINRYLDPYRWARKFSELKLNAKTLSLRTVRSKSEFSEYGGDTDEQGRLRPPKAEFGNELRTLTKRGVEIGIFYTAYVQREITRATQFFQTFSDYQLEGKVTVNVNPRVTHTYTTLQSQNMLLTEIETWLKQRFTD